MNSAAPQSDSSPQAHAFAEQVSAWVFRFAGLILPGEVLDLACGRGRHARLLARLGHAVLAVDRDPIALEAAAGPGITVQQVDLEAEGAIWPYAADRFSGIVVTNYLYRPLFPHLFRSLAPDGVLIYETFAKGNEHFGKPSSPQFLLEKGELLQLVASECGAAGRVVAFEDGYVATPKPAMVQRICVTKSAANRPPDQLRI